VEPWGRGAACVALVVPNRVLEPELGRRLELHREDQAGDTRNVVGELEGARELDQPQGVDDDVVVREGHDLASCLGEPAVVRHRESGERVANVERFGTSA
jgi:hypothetical protein